MEIVRVYSIPNCPFCKELKDLLEKEEIQFVDVNVNAPENEEEYLKLQKITNSNDVPIVKIKKQILVPNVSFHSIPQACSLVKKFLI